jgi:hypothetical protein
MKVKFVPALVDMRVSAMEGVEFLLSSGNHSGSTQQGEYDGRRMRIIRTDDLYNYGDHACTKGGDVRLPQIIGQIRGDSGKANIIIGHPILKSLFLEGEQSCVKNGSY